MARRSCFFPTYPLGHSVSEINSMGTTSVEREDCDESIVERKRLVAEDLHTREDVATAENKIGRAHV